MGAIPAIANISLIVRLVDSPLHSRTLIPKREVKNESGRKLYAVSLGLGRIYIVHDLGAALT